MGSHALSRKTYVVSAVLGAALFGLGCPQPVEPPKPTPAALAVSPSTQEFGTLTVGQTSPAFTFTVTNGGQANSGSVSATITGTDAAQFKIGTNNCSAALEGGKTCTVLVTFTPSSGGAKTATLSIAGEPGGTVTASLTGTGRALDPASLSVSPILQDFGSVAINQSSSTISFTVSNTGGSPSGAPTVTLGGTNASEFALASNGCSAPIAAGSNCTFSVRFSPTTVGSKMATVAVAGMPGGNASVTLQGVGTGTSGLSINPTPFAFGSVVTGTSSADAIFTVTNVGTIASGMISATIGGTNATQFTLGTNGCTTLAAGANCTIAVRFAPTSPSMATASLNVSATPGGMASAALSGTGITPASISITPADFDFGPVSNGTTSSSFAFTVRNNGGVATPAGGLTATLSGTASASYTVTNGCSGAPLAPNATCMVSVRFSPTTSGAKPAMLTVSGGMSLTAVANLNGTGVAPASISIAPTPQAFPDTSVGAASSGITFTVTNNGGTATPALTTALSGANATEFQITSGGNGCAGLALPPAGTCTITVTFNPTSAGAKAASLTANGGTAGSTTATLSGTGISPASIGVSVASQDFGTVAVGSTSASAVITVTNNGGLPSGTPVVALSGTNSSQFGIVANGCTAILAPAGTCTVTVNFAPTSVGAKVGALDVSATPGGSRSVALNGNAISAAALGISPTPQAFNTVINGVSSATVTFTVTNSGTQTTGALAIAFGGADASQFAIVAPGSGTQCAAGVTTLATGISCTIGVQFRPTSAGAKTATLDVTGAPGGTTSASLTGTGDNQIRMTLPAPTPPQTTVSPFNYGQRGIGTTTPQVFTWQNFGVAATPVMTAPTLAGANMSEFAITANTCTASIAAGATCTVTVAFNPTTGGAKTATVSLNNTGVGLAEVLTVNGTGIGGLTIVNTPAVAVPMVGFTSAGDYHYRDVLLGASAFKDYTITCSTPTGCGMATTNLGGNTSEFAVTNDTCAGTPRPVGPGGDCTIRVLFYPSSLGAKTATLTVSSQANPLNVHTINLLGTGTPSQTLTVTGTAAYGTVGIGDTATQTFTVTNAALAPTSTALTLAVANTVGAGFSLVAPTGMECVTTVTTLAAGASCSFRVRYAPVATTGAYAGTVTVTAATGAPAGIVTNVTGTGQSLLTVAPTSNNFGSVQRQATSGDVAFTITNTGTSATGALSAVLAGDVGYVLGTTTCPAPGLAAGANCVQNVRLTPALGHALGATTVPSTLTVTDVGMTGRTAQATLTGTVTDGQNQTFTMAPVSPTDFGTAAVLIAPGTNTRTFTFSNAGDYALNIQARTGAGNTGDFTIVSDTCTAATLAARSTCTVVIRFLPTVAGLRTATLTWTPVAAQVPATPAAVALVVNGTGVAAGGLVIGPTPESFGGSVLTVPVTRTFTVTNTAGVASGAFNMLALADAIGPLQPACVGCAAHFAYSAVQPMTGRCPINPAPFADAAAPLAAGASCTVNVTFTPTTAGFKAATMAITGGALYSVISGTGQNAASLAIAGANGGAFGNTATGVPVTSVYTVTNNGDVTSGTVAVTLGGADSTSYSIANNTCTTVPPTGGVLPNTCTLDVVFNPSTQGLKNATITAGGNVVALTGTGTQPPTLSISPSAPVVFATQFIGLTNMQTFTVSNAVGAATSSGVSMTLTGTDFSRTGGTCAVPPAALTTLAGGASCTYIITYAPTGTPGARSGSISVSAAQGATPALTNTFTATAAGALTVDVGNPMPVALSAVAQVGMVSGGTASQVFTFTNNGPLSGRLSTVLTGANYSITANTCANAALTQTPAGGSTCAVTVRFQPTAVGVTTATLTVSGTPGNSVTATINGTGT